MNAYIKSMFTQDVRAADRIYMKGEVSNCKYHTSGHIYFSLKDESWNDCLRHVCQCQRSGLAFGMCEGQQVRSASDSVSVYERGRHISALCIQDSV